MNPVGFDLPGNPLSRKAYQQAVAGWLRQVARNSAGFLDNLFFDGTPMGADRVHTHHITTVAVECAKLKEFYTRRPRPWRRRCDAPKQPRLEISVLHKRRVPK